MTCEHVMIENDGDHFRCTECHENVVLRTKAGVIITPQDIDGWVTEAERGYR